MDDLGGLGSGFASAVKQVNDAGTNVEKIRQNREELRQKAEMLQLRQNLDQREGETHNLKTQQLQLQIEQLQLAQFKQNMQTQLRTQGYFSEDITEDPMYANLFGNWRMMNPKQQADIREEALADAAKKAGVDPKQAKYFVDSKMNIMALHENAVFSALGVDRPKEKREENTQNFEALAYDKAYKALQDGDVEKAKQFMEMIGKVSQNRTTAAQEKDRRISELSMKLYEGPLSSEEIAFVAGLPPAVSSSLLYRHLQKATGINAGQVVITDNLDHYQTQQLAEVVQVLSNNPAFAKTLENIDKKSSSEYVAALLNAAKVFSIPLDGKSAEAEIGRRSKGISDALVNIATRYMGTNQEDTLQKLGSEIAFQHVVNIYGHEKFGSALTEGEVERLNTFFGTKWTGDQQFLIALSSELEKEKASLLNLRNSNPALFAVVGDRIKAIIQAEYMVNRTIAASVHAKTFNGGKPVKNLTQVKEFYNSLDKSNSQWAVRARELEAQANKLGFGLFGAKAQAPAAPNTEQLTQPTQPTQPTDQNNQGLGDLVKMLQQL